LSTLLRLEARRAQAHLRKTALGTLLFMGVMFAIFGGRRDGSGMALALIGFIYGMVPGMRSLMDKLDGSLDFLTSLPVDPWRLVAAHLTACVAWAPAAALPWTAAAMLAAPTVLEVPLGPVACAGVLLVLWLAVAGLNAVVSGALVRFPVETLGWLPMIALLALAGLGQLLDYIWPEADAISLDWISSPWAPLLIFGAAVLFLSSGLALGALLLHSGYRRFRPSTVTLPSRVAGFSN